MRPYSERNFSKELLELYRRATQLVNRLPDPPDSMEHRCHEVARAIAHALNEEQKRRHGRGVEPLAVVDGKFGGADHSRISVPTRLSGAVNDYILDVYAVGSLPPVQLVDNWPLLRRGYERGQVRDDIRQNRLRWMLAMLCVEGEPR